MKDGKYNIYQRLSTSSALLLFCILLLTTYLFLSLTTQLPLFSSEVFAKQGNFKSVNVNQISLYSKATYSNPTATTAVVTVNNNNTLAINSFHLKAKSDIATAAPSSSSNPKVIEKLSDKHIYRVLIRSNQSFDSLPKDGFNMQILFLNASSSSATATTAAIVSPSSPIVMKELVPVNSFDITIYSNNGKVLWQKTNQTINTATAFEKVTFTNASGYSSGGITIQITNIKPSPVPIGAAIPLFSGSNNSNGINSSTAPRGGGFIHTNNKMLADSITFTALVAAK
jgi:hypothetical protein